MTPRIAVGEDPRTAVAPPGTSDASAVTSAAIGSQAPPQRLVTPGSAVAWAAGAAVLAALWMWGSSFQLYVGGVVLIYAISAIGLQWLMGRAGQVSLGNAALMAIGAYSTAVVASQPWAPFPVPVVLSTLVGAVVGLVIGLPALRLRGIYLALATLALHFITVSMADRYQASTGKISGLSVPVAEIGGIRFAQGRSFLVLLAVLLAAVVVLLANLYRHSPGRLWTSIHESELAASTLGVDVTRWKMTAFVGSSALIAFSGSLWAYYSRSVSFETFSLDLAISFIVMIILGGMGSIGGAIAGAAIVTILPYLTRELSGRIPGESGFGAWLAENTYHLNYGLYGVVLMLVLVYWPGGLAPGLRALSERVARRGARNGAEPETAPEMHDGHEGSAVELGVEPAGRPATDLVAAEAGLAGQGALLEVRDLSVTYGAGAHAVEAVDLVVPPSRIVALVGRNGAGKTSTLRAISGFFRSEGAGTHVGGSIRFEDRDITGWTPAATAPLGIVLIPERDKVFPSISTADHLRMVAPRGRVPDEVYELFPWLHERAHLSAGLLSGGERQMLAMAMAWLLRPKLLLVDELSLGLAPVIVRELVAKLAEISEREQMAVLLVEQNATAALSIAHYGYVLESGVLVAHGTPADLQGDPAVKAAYLGGGS